VISIFFLISPSQKVNFKYSNLLLTVTKKENNNNSKKRKWKQKKHAFVFEKYLINPLPPSDAVQQQKKIFWRICSVL